MNALAEELKRKVFHLAILWIVIIYAILFVLFSRKIALLVLVVLLLIFLFSEFLRLDLGFKIHFFHRLLRKKEGKRLHGAVYFLLSAIISLMVFDFPIALAALFMATFGDIAAAIFGKKYGRRKIYKKKTYVGTFAAFLVNLVVGFLVLASPLIVIVMAFGASLVETLSDKIDDNLSVPLLAGALGQVLLFFL